MRNIEVLAERKIRMPLTLAAFGLTALMLTGCPTGQQTPPTAEEVTSGIEYFELEDVMAANGEPVQCAMYATGTMGTRESKSWFGFACDFEGTAAFPGEVPAEG